jgi:hypothetical protein
LFVETLDPFNTGKIDFNQFVKGMSKLTSEQGIFNSSGANNESAEITNFDEFDSLAAKGDPFGQFTNGSNPVIYFLAFTKRDFCLTLKLKINTNKKSRHIRCQMTPSTSTIQTIRRTITEEQVLNSRMETLTRLRSTRTTR